MSRLIFEVCKQCFWLNNDVTNTDDKYIDYDAYALKSYKYEIKKINVIILMKSCQKRKQDKERHQKWHHPYPKELGNPAFYFLTNTASPVDVSISSFDDFSSNDSKSFNCPSIEFTSLKKNG